MLSKEEIKQVSKLLQKKYRDSQKMFIAEGKRLVSEGLDSNFKCLEVLITNDFKNSENEYWKFLESKNMKTSTTSSKDFTKISSTKNPQGIAAVFEIPTNKTLQKDDKKIICLENISDPGNVGTILRSCDWFGIKSVIMSNDCADIYNPKVLRASMGAVFNLNILENVDLVAELTKLKKENYKTYYADMKGIDYRELKLNEKFVLTFCNEAFGPSISLKNVCDDAITISKRGNIDSLNVAAAAAVILSRLT